MERDPRVPQAGLVEGARANRDCLTVLVALTRIMEVWT